MPPAIDPGPEAAHGPYQFSRVTNTLISPVLFRA
jgi:hypothetical protein